MFEKQFAERDLARIRNLITKKFGAATAVQAGYTPSTQTHVEGDVWEEKGRQFTLKEGKTIPVLRTKMLRDLTRVPLSCPVCNRSIVSESDIKLMHLRKACLACVTEAETDMKIAGTYQAYEDKHIKANLNSWINEMESDLAEIVGVQSREMAMTEAGDSEVWVGGSDTISVDSITERIDILKKV